MQIILSRKGFDSSAGGIPSPILPDGTLLPLPIPQTNGPVKFSALKHSGMTLSSLIKQLGGKCWRSGCHLDPDIMPGLIERPDNWQPSLGQYGAAQNHLSIEGVGEGDLFLFFSWFRQTEWYREKGKKQLRFIADAPDLHVIYGWLQIGQIISNPHLNPEELAFLGKHPHLQKAYDSNTIYLPTEKLMLFGEGVSGTDASGDITGLPGAGCLSRLVTRQEQAGKELTGQAKDSFRPVRQLTVPGHKRTVWQLPECLWPEHSEKVLSYHRKPERWIEQGQTTILQSAFRGQEFVVQSKNNKAVRDWLISLLAE